MTLFDGVILGLVQGLTEFIPVSSTGHLIIAREILNIESEQGLAIDAVLQLATVIATLFYFRKELYQMYRATLPQKRDEAPAGAVTRRLVFALLLGTIPSIIFGLLLEDTMEEFFRDPELVALALIAGSVLFLFAEWIFSLYAARGLARSEMTVSQGFTIGFFQALALIPGISRSGATISGGLILGLTRLEAARFGFLLSIPVIAGSGLKKLFELGSDGILASVGLPILVGGIVAGVSGFFAIRFMLAFLKEYSLVHFVVYRIVLATLVLWLLP